jgi:hypothetical protein
VLHEGEQRSLPVTIEPWPRSQWDARDAPMTPGRPKLTIRADLGLSLAAIPTADRAKLGLEAGLAGVLVKDVVPGSDAARRGMTGGDVILRVQDRSVAKPADLQEGINAAANEKHRFVMMLVLPKVRTIPGPSWRALQLPHPEGPEAQVTAKASQQ